MRHRRRAVWEVLRDISLTRVGGWFLIGDFNELLNNGEKLGGPAREESSFFEFRAMQRDCRLKEPPSFGDPFSWAGVREIFTNGVKEKVWVQCRLDRAFGNAELFRLFPGAHIKYLERTGSDHRPVLASLVPAQTRRKGRFTFDKRWCTKPEVMQVVRKGWNLNTGGNGGTVTERIQTCRKELSKWKKSVNVNSNEQIKKLRQTLEAESQKQYPDLQLLAATRMELEKTYKEEEAFWKQKCKNSWLQVGDKNTTVFHGWVETRRMKNRIQSLIDNSGIEYHDEERKAEIAVQYFQDLFHSGGSQNAEVLLEGMQVRVSDRMNVSLTTPVTDAEIKHVVKAIKSDSAPGIDGMTGHFFQKYWSVTGEQVTKEVKEFFVSGVIPTDWNHTQLCLLPKVPNANQMKDLRPISLCSVIYKIISKVLSNRLKTILPRIVSQTQGAFVAGRLISDNLLIAHEMIHGLKTNPNCRGDFIAIKTDMSKAYDRVEWDFLEILFF